MSSTTDNNEESWSLCSTIHLAVSVYKGEGGGGGGGCGGSINQRKNKKGKGRAFESINLSRFTTFSASHSVFFSANSFTTTMVGCYDSGSSPLLCAEDNSSILGFDDDGEADGVVGSGHLANGYPAERQIGGLFEDGFGDIPLQSDECLAMLVSREFEYLPKDDYARRLQTGALELSVRREAIDWIGKVHAHYNFGPLSAYLSINYLDRFLSYYELPGKTWMTQLLSVACLSLASKMEETEVPLSLDLQVGESKYVFEAKTIQRMELLVLSTLKWRMCAVTPFSFIDYFLQKFSDGSSLQMPLLSQSVDLILNTIRRIDLLEFRPSEIAAAVALSVSRGSNGLDAKEAFCSCTHIDNERTLRCYEVITDMAFISRPFKSASGSISSVPQSPVGVLDAACLSYKSDDATVGSEAVSHQTSPDAKRRKIDRLTTS